MKLTRILLPVGLLAVSGLRGQNPLPPPEQAHPFHDAGPGRRPTWPPHPPLHPPPHPLMKALDRDRDGELSAAEIAGAADALRALDRDGDGKLSRIELRPAHAPPPPPDADPEEAP